MKWNGNAECRRPESQGAEGIGPGRGYSSSVGKGIGREVCLSCAPSPENYCSFSGSCEICCILDAVLVQSSQLSHMVDVSSMHDIIHTSQQSRALCGGRDVEGVEWESLPPPNWVGKFLSCIDYILAHLNTF